MLLVKYKEVILPSIKQDARRKMMAHYCRLFNELQWMAYQLPSVQRKRGVQVRLFYITYFLTYLSKALWGDPVMSVYLHSIFVHWAPFFMLCDFRNSSTEQGEAWLAFLKRVFRSYTNRHPSEALLELLQRMHEEAEVRRVTGKKSRPTKYSRISREFRKRYEFEECSFFLSPTHSALLDCLRENGFSEGVDWEVVDGQVIFNTLSAIKE